MRNVLDTTKTHSESEQTIEQTVELPVIYDTKTLMWIQRGFPLIKTHRIKLYDMDIMQHSDARCFIGFTL